MLARMVKSWAAALCLIQAASAVRVETSQEFPLGSEVENMVMRPSGSILATVFTYPRIYEVAVADKATPRLIHTFDNTTGACGISEAPGQDQYFVLTGTFNWTTFAPEPGTFAINRLSFDQKCGKAIVEEIAPLSTLDQPNGMVSVPNTPLVIIADCRAGLVYQFNTETLELKIYFDHPLLKPGDTVPIFGVNGLKLSQGYLYFSSTNQAIVARIKATGTEHKLEGDPEIVATKTPVDDILIDDETGDVYMAEQGTVNGLGLITQSSYGSAPKTIAHGPEWGPTAAIWTNEPQTIAVSLTGGFLQFNTGNYTGGGKLAFVHLD